MKIQKSPPLCSVCGEWCVVLCGASLEQEDKIEPGSGFWMSGSAINPRSTRGVFLKEPVKK